MGSDVERADDHHHHVPVGTVEEHDALGGGLRVHVDVDLGRAVGFGRKPAFRIALGHETRVGWDVHHGVCGFSLIGQVVDRGAVLRILFVVFARGDLFEGRAGDVFGICEPDVRAADVRIGIVEAVDGRDIALGVVEDDVAFVLAIHVDDGPAFDAAYREPVLLVRQRLAVGVVAFIAGEVAFECQRGFGVVRPGFGVGQFVGIVDLELAERPVGRGSFSNKVPISAMPSGLAAWIGPGLACCVSVAKT